MTKHARGRIAGGIAGMGMVLVVSGCQTPPTFGEPEETYGAAVRHNIAVQTVNPDPQNKLTPPAHDAARAAKSMERYKTDKVKQPVEIRTSDVGGGQ
jgi:hypothetical protein